MNKNTPSNISSKGGLLSLDFLDVLRKENSQYEYVKFNTFNTFSGNNFESKEEFDSQISNVWSELIERWDTISNRYKNMNVSDARTKWILPLLRTLGFEPVFNKQNLVALKESKLQFKLSHQGWLWEKAPALNLVSPSQSLEEKDDPNHRKGRSPHDEMQAFLNVATYCRWGIVTNGILLRVLREYHHTTTKGYVEFDLENIFRERNFSDFLLLYKICHASRFTVERNGICILEKFYKESLATGITIGQNLRRNVKSAIEYFGNGFLTEELIERLIKDEEECKKFYSDIMIIIYRILFLLFAEQRAMLPTRGSLYSEEYSITKLREIAEQYEVADEYSDLWEGLKVTFKILKNGFSPLKVFGYNGSLFDDNELQLLNVLSCRNKDLIQAVRYLTHIEEEGMLKRINYLDVGVEEIGSIYESLLEFLPRILKNSVIIEGKTILPRRFFLDPRNTSRKKTGSYYTDPRLIDILIKSALNPVMKRFVYQVSDTEKEKQLLDIKICDPSCGSGAFLIASTNYLARELARVRTTDYEPSERELRKARRDVLQHCIYGVDLNPMAVELTKVSLWINAVVEDTPLNFLDHHIKCGNSIIGTTFKLLDKGLPDQAFNPIGDDDKKFSKLVKQRNKTSIHTMDLDEFVETSESKVLGKFSNLNELVELKPDDISIKKLRYQNILSSSDYKNIRMALDAWTAAFFWELSPDCAPPPITSTIRNIVAGRISIVDERTIRTIQELSSEFNFFHWELEFPDVFEKGGFDCILTNPPWERIKVQEKEFFSIYDEKIAAVRSSERKQLIAKLKKIDPTLWNKYVKAVRNSDLQGKYLKNSGRYDFITGDINTSIIFAEHVLNTISYEGLTGMILPTGIVTLETFKKFFQHLIDTKKLKSLYDFDNKKGLFPVHREIKFSLITVGKIPTENSTFSFSLLDPDEINDDMKRITLNKEDFEILNPNTRTCPIFKTKKDAELVINIHKRIPSAVIDSKKYNPWQIYYIRLIDLDDHKDEVLTAKELEELGFIRSSHYYKNGTEVYIPVLEAKMIHQFDHRFATFVDATKEQIVDGQPRDSLEPEHLDRKYEITPRYWVKESFQKGLMVKYHHNRNWLFVYRDTTGSNNQRTAIASIIPPFSATRSLPCVGIIEWKKSLFLLANINTIVLDFVVRTKVSSQHLTFGVFRQLPLIPPKTYDTLPNEISKKIIDYVTKLTFTSYSLRSFAEDFGISDDPFYWDSEERMKLTGELNAIYAHLYGLNKTELLNMLDSFSALRDTEFKKFGIYQTKEVVLTYYEKYIGRIKPALVDPY